MKILGLDPGLATIGFGIIEQQSIDNTLPKQNQQNSINLLDFGIIQTQSNMEMGERLSIIYNDLHALINHWQPNLIAIEKLFFYRMGNTIAVAQARGVIMLVVAQHKITYIEFAPPQVKQMLTGMGNANKLEVQQAVARELNLDYTPKPDDAADALALALAALFQL